MSRASEITLFIVLIQAAIGFVDASGMFDQSYYSVPSNNASYTLTDLGSYASQAEEDTSISSQIDLYLDWAWDSFFIGLKILFAVLFVLPTLINVFGIPGILATFIQVGIYYVYATWYAQYKSGRGWKAYE
jgi:hypothetical protein